MRNNTKVRVKKKKSVFKQLTLEERVKIEVKYRDGMSFREIENYLGNGRTGGSICREVDGKLRRGIGKYQAYVSHTVALTRRYGKKPTRLKNELIRSYTKEKMRLGWSPEQISIRLPIDHQEYEISYEAIYQYVYSQVRRGGNGKVKNGCEDLRPYLYRRHTRRQKKGLRQAQRVERPVLPSIEDRPASVEKRKEVGHFEDDTIVSRQSLVRLKSINERASGVLFLGKMKNGTSEEFTRVVCDRLRDIPSPYLKTLTRDRGTENMGWIDIESRLSIRVYFAHPYCSQERGSNENLNGLVRRFFPKKTDFAKVSDEEIRKIEYLINTRPRKRFGGKTPLEVLLEKTGVAITY